MGNEDFWFRVVVIGAGVLSIGLIAAALFMK
jgi:hypothetical protein